MILKKVCLSATSFLVMLHCMCMHEFFSACMQLTDLLVQFNKCRWFGYLHFVKFINDKLHVEQSVSRSEHISETHVQTPLFKCPIKHSYMQCNLHF